MAFKITIKEIKTITKHNSRGEWKVIKERLVTQNEIENSGYRQDNSDAIREALKAGTLIIKEYGYGPGFDTIEQVEAMVYEQWVDTLVIGQVITAVNGQGT